MKTVLLCEYCLKVVTVLDTRCLDDNWRCCGEKMATIWSGVKKKSKNKTEKEVHA